MVSPAPLNQHPPLNTTLFIRDLGSSLSRLLTSIDNGTRALKTEIACQSAEISRTKEVNKRAETQR